jgi:hypothetical protein
VAALLKIVEKIVELEMAVLVRGRTNSQVVLLG